MSTQILSNKLTRLNTLFAMVITTLFAVQAHAMFGFEPYYKFGAVYTRSIVVDPSTNMPIWVEYDETGREAGVIGGMQDGDFTFSGTEYRAYHDQYTQIMEDMPDAIWMSVYDYLAQAEYLAYNDETFSPVEINPDYDNVQFVLVRSKEQTQIADGEYHLLARFPVDVRQPVAADFASLLLRTDPASGAVSSIITPAEPDYNIGFRVKFFGPEGDDTGEEALDGVDTTTINYRKATDVIYGPIKGARITTTPAARITDGAETGEDGKYSMHYTLPPCPGFTFSYTTPAYLELQYNRFNPRLPGYRIYWQQRLDYDFCNGLAATAPPFIRSAVIGILATAATPIKRPRDFPIDIMVLNGHARLENPDGSGVDVTPELTDIQSVFALDNFSKSATPPTYDLSVPSFVRQTQSYYDFDKDGEYETTVLGRVVEVPVEGGEEGETEKLFFPQTDQDYPCVTSRDEQGELCSHQGVYLSSTGNLPAEAQPDILRIADWGLDDNSEFQDKGLATEMGEIDLSNTDLYIFRESNGELIAERRGLNTSEANASTKGLQGAADGRFFYTLEMRGPREGIYSASYLRRNPRDPVTGNPVGPQNAYRFWQQQSGVVEKFWNREADHLRPGERIRIIAINRVTGYMGSVTTELKAHSNTDTDDNGDTIERNAMMIDYSVNDIVMRPPNLKVWAERSYTVEQGLTRGTQYLGDDARDPTDDSQKAAPVIGFEGAGLGTDTAIVVYTEWLDQDGRALPEALGDYGYTARFAKIVAPNQLDDAAVGQADDGSGAVAQFPIKPGKHTSVIRFSNPNSNREHLYIHVSGQPFTRQADFEQLQVFQTTDASTGMQESRPDRYVPIKVPVYNEDESLQAQKTYRDYVEAQGEDADITTPKPEPIYEWLYRPEFQFSVYDLTVQEIRRQVSEDDVEEIYTADRPAISSVDDLVTFTYNLLSRDINGDGLDNDTLSAYSYEGERELIIALGEEELRATIGSNQTITFENLDVLAIAALDPEDYLSLRLYSNNDTANVLWEWAFGEPLNSAPERGYVNADRPTLDLGTFLAGINLDEPKQVVVNWALYGADGSLSSSSTSSDIGVFSNQLNASVTAGEVYTIKARIVSSEDNRYVVGTEATIGPFEVVPGVPETITLTAENNKTEVLCDGQDKTVIVAEVLDQNGNHVADGTPVSWVIGYSGYVESEESQTVGGFVKLTYQSGIETLATEIIANAGNATGTISITKNPFDFDLSISNNEIQAGSVQTLSLTINANAYSDNPLEITWQTDKGQILGTQTLSSTTATAEFQPGNIPGDTFITANIAGVEKGVGVNITPANPGAITLDLSAISSATGGGSAMIEGIDGTFRAVTVPTSTAATLYGIPNTEFNLQLGTFFAPNAHPYAQYALSGIDYELDVNNAPVNPYAYDHINQLNAAISGSVTEDSEESFSQPGQSLHFSSDGKLTIAPDSKLEIEDDLFAIIKFRRDNNASICSGDCTNPTPVLDRAADAELIRSATGLGISWVLDLVKDDNQDIRIRAIARTDQGRFAVISDAIIQDEQWYIAGIRIRNGQLELGVGDERQAVAMTGTLANVSGSQIVLADSFRGNLDGFEIGQENLANALITVNGQIAESVMIGSDGTANINLAATDSGLQVPQMVGFTGTYATTNAGLETKELRLFEKVYSRITGLPTFGAALAADTTTSDQETGLLVTSSTIFGWAMDWVDSKLENALGPNIYGPVKQAAKFLSSILGIDDVITIVDAIIKAATGRIEEVSALDVTFAVLGLGLTVVAVITTPATAGAGAVAATEVRTSLTIAKTLLKELFSLGISPATVYKAGGSTVRYIFDLLKDMGKGGGAARARVIGDLADLGVALKKLVLNSSIGLWNFFIGTANSIKGLKRFIKFMKHTDDVVAGCVDDLAFEDAKYLNGVQLKLMARLYGTSLVDVANAAPACPIGFASFIADVLVRNGNNGQKIADEVMDLTNNLMDMGLYLNRSSFESLELLAKNGHGPTVSNLLDNLENARLGNYFTLDAMKVDYGDGIVLDELLDAVASIPRGQTVDAVKVYDNILKELGVKSVGNVRGIYGEGRTFRRLQTEPLIPGRQDLIIDTSSLKVGDNVNTPNANNVQGADAEGVLKGLTGDGRPLLVEVKTYTSMSKAKIYSTDPGGFMKQAEKYFEVNITESFDLVSGGWQNGKPHLHYELLGDAWTKLDGSARKNYEHMRDMLSKVCGEFLKKNPLLATPPASFDCVEDITINVVPDKIVPLTSN